VVTPATKPKGSQFVLHAKALHGNPFDGHTLAPVIAELGALTGVETRRIHVDKGYRGHTHIQKFRVSLVRQVQIVHVLEGEQPRHQPGRQAGLARYPACRHSQSADRAGGNRSF